MRAISFLKKLNERMPDGVKRIAAPLIREQLIGNHIFLDQFHELDDADSMSQAELAEVQLIKLKNCLIRAYENVPYYQKIFDDVAFSPYTLTAFEDIKTIPILEKETIQSCYDSLQDVTCSDFYEATTGGSTGVATTIALDRASIYRERAFIYHFWKHFGYDFKKSRLATFRGIPGDKIAKENPLYGEIQLTPFNLSKNTIHKYVQAINQFKADYIQGYPSAVALFCSLAKEVGLKLKAPIKAIFLISENTLDWQKKEIESFFSCPIAPFYGHTERSVFAECTLGLERGYSFDPLYGFTEVLDDGAIVCTGFINPRMPLIRYKLDDSAISVSESHFNIIGHRDGVALVGLNGEQITQTSFEGMHTEALSGVSAYQLVQRKRGFCEFLFKAEKEFDQNTIKNIAAELSKGIPALNWSPIQVESFELTDRGKFKPIVVRLED